MLLQKKSKRRQNKLTKGRKSYQLSLPFLYSLGVTPTHFLNTVEKYNGSENPDNAATFFTDSNP